MLAHAQMTTILPVKNLQRAREFYERKLGLEPVGLQQDGKFVLRCNGSELALFPKPEGTKAEHTAVSFLVDDIVGEITDLERRGVAFHDYDLPGLKTVGHVCLLGTEKTAWFGDTEGNILCLHQTVGVTA